MRPRCLLAVLVFGTFLSLGCANKNGMFGVSRQSWDSMTPSEQSAVIDSYNARQREEAATDPGERAATQLPIIPLADGRETTRLGENSRGLRNEPSGTVETGVATRAITWGGSIDPGDMLASIAQRWPSQ